MRSSNRRMRGSRRRAPAYGPPRCVSVPARGARYVCAPANEKALQAIERPRLMVAVAQPGTGRDSAQDPYGLGVSGVLGLYDLADTSLLRSLTLMVTLLAGLGVSNPLVMLIPWRLNDFGASQAVGTTPRQVVAVVIWCSVTRRAPCQGPGRRVVPFGRRDARRTGETSGETRRKLARARAVGQSSDPARISVTRDASSQDDDLRPRLVQREHPVHAVHSQPARGTGGDPPVGEGSAGRTLTEHAVVPDEPNVAVRGDGDSRCRDEGGEAREKKGETP